MRNFSPRLRRAFTLVELLIVIIIIAVLAAVAIPKFANSSTRSKESTLRSNLKIVRNAIDMARSDTGLNVKLPADLASPTAPALMNTPGGTTGVAVPAGSWRGPYVEAVPVDPISGTALTWTEATTIVKPSATGNDSSGVAFNTY